MDAARLLRGVGAAETQAAHRWLAANSIGQDDLSILLEEHSAAKSLVAAMGLHGAGLRIVQERLKLLPGAAASTSHRLPSHAQQLVQHARPTNDPGRRVPTAPPTPRPTTQATRQLLNHYIRAAKTGSGTAIAYFKATKCETHLNIHESHMVFAHNVPCPARSFMVMREPCARAESQIAHMFYGYANGRSWFPYTWHNQTLNLSASTSLLDLAQFVNASHAHRSRVMGTHVDIFFAQSRYVGPCTEVLCLESGRLEPTLQRLCNSTRLLPPSEHVGRGSRSRDASATIDGGCAAVRDVYSDDWRLYREHCADFL